MRHSARITTALVAAALCAAPALAQTTGGVGLGLSGGYFSFGGNDFETTDAGFGFEATARMHLGPSWQLLGGFGMSWHDDSYIQETITGLRVSVEPRYVFPSQGKLTPFVGAQGGYVRASATVSGTSGSQSGYYFGGTGGLDVEMSPTMSFEAKVLFGSVHLGDAKYGGSTIIGSSADGTILGLELGVVLLLGGK